jgi:Domain of unknown function (DUF932)
VSSFRGEHYTVVSKHYNLVQHTDLFDRACEAMEAAQIGLGQVGVQLTLSVCGSKMALTFTFPKHFDFDPGDGHVLKLSFHCVNSVDARCRLRIMLGWFRFICGNGLIVGTARLVQRFVHNHLELPDLNSLLVEGLRCAEAEKSLFAKWIKKPINWNQLQKWTDAELRRGWGPLAAARVYFICETGHDGRFAKPGERALPHRKSMIRTANVPGAPSQAKSIYDVANVAVAAAISAGVGTVATTVEPRPCLTPS